MWVSGLCAGFSVECGCHRAQALTIQGEGRCLILACISAAAVVVRDVEMSSTKCAFVRKHGVQPMITLPAPAPAPVHFILPRHIRSFFGCLHVHARICKRTQVTKHKSRLNTRLLNTRTPAKRTQATKYKSRLNTRLPPNAP